MDDTVVTNTPAHLWVVGVFALLWNCIGAYDYLMSHIQDVAYFESAGLDAAAYDWFKGIPIWARAAWAIGVWGSVLGSLLLLIRSRYAALVYVVSIAAVLMTFAYQFTSVRPASLHGGIVSLMPVLVLILVIAQWYYARRMTQAGVLH